MPTRFKELRLFLGLDQKEMARWFGTKQSVVSLWETGKRTPPLREAAVKFGVSIDWLEGLSSRMWGERVSLLGRSYRRSLLTLPSDRRQELVKMTPTGRVLHAYQALASGAPDLITEAYFARVLGTDEVTFQAVLEQRESLAEKALQRMADYIGISERWYLAGDLLMVDASGLQEYLPLVQQMRAEGITPDDFWRIWSVIRSLRDGAP